METITENYDWPLFELQKQLCFSHHPLGLLAHCEVKPQYTDFGDYSDVRKGHIRESLVPMNFHVGLFLLLLRGKIGFFYMLN